MNNPITKYVAVAAVLIIAAFAGAQIFTATGNNRPVEIARKPDIKASANAQQNTNLELDSSPQIELAQDQAGEKLENLKKMFAAGDIEGLMSVLGDSEAKYEYKVAAANYLAQIGDTQAIETLEELSLQWQGDETENPFAAAIATIKGQQNKEIEPKPLAVVPDEPVADAKADEPAAVIKPETQNNASEKIDLKLNLKQGQKFGTKLIVDQKITQTVNGKEQKINQKMTFGFISEVLAVNTDGIIALKTTHRIIQTKMDGPMGSTEYDSTKPPADVNSLNPQERMMAQMWSAMKGEGFVMDITPRGKIEDVHDYDEMWERMMEKLTGNDPQLAKVMKDMMKNFVSEDALKQSGGDIMMQFLDEPVAIGDMWYDITSIDVGFPIDMDITYMLKDRKDGIAFINIISKMDMGDQDSKLIEVGKIKMNMQLSGTQTGTSEIDEATGWLLRSKVEQNFSGVIKMAPNEQMPNGMSIPMTIQSTTTAEPMEVE